MTRGMRGSGFPPVAILRGRDPMIGTGDLRKANPRIRRAGRNGLATPNRVKLSSLRIRKS